MKAIKTNQEVLDALDDNLAMIDWLIAKKWTQDIDKMLGLLIILAGMRGYPKDVMDLNTAVLLEEAVIRFQDKKLFKLGYERYISFLIRVNQQKVLGAESLLMSAFTDLFLIDTSETNLECYKLMQQLLKGDISQGNVTSLQLLLDKLSDKLGKDVIEKIRLEQSQDFLGDFAKILGY